MSFLKIIKNKLLISVLFILIIIVVPSFIFSIYQYSTITDEEQVIDDVYKNQLESILFSINQYSIDVVDSWVNNLNNIYKGKNSDIEELSNLIDQYEIIQQLNIKHITDLVDEGIEISKLNNSEIINTNINNYLQSHLDEINNLSSYLKNDYQKVIGVESDSVPEYSFLIFILESDDELNLGIFTIRTEQFILENLFPRTQQIAEDKMNILVFEKNQNRIIFSNQAIDDVSEVQKSKELWLFPNYLVGIQLTGSTLDDLVKKRVYTVLILIVLFNVLVILGIWMLYYNIKREIELAKIKNDFVSNVSHDLRTPLAMLSMYSETLLMGRVKDDKKKQEYYEIIQEETNRLNGIVNNILNFSRIENNKSNYQFSNASLNEIIDDILRVYKYELSSKGFTCKFIPDNDLSLINIDQNAIKDAVINLLSNSIKYCNQKKYIEIQTGKYNAYQFIEIKDHGIGISEKDQKLIFDKFYRVTEENLAHKAPGSGLGLSIIKHIMDAHNGDIVVKSKLNEGSSFKLLFPTKDE